MFDLDGTVIDANSFTIWVVELLLGRVAGVGAVRRLSIAVSCGFALARRKLLRQSHAQFKRRIQRIWSRVEVAGTPSLATDALVRRLLAHVRPNLRPLLGEVAAGRRDGVLTTAAAAEYALPLASRLGFHEVVATPAGGGEDSIDNVGLVKRDRTIAQLRRLGWDERPRVFFTDHLDDWPLMRASKAIVWFGADADLETFRSKLPGILVVAGRAITPTDIDAVMRTLQQSGAERA